MPKPPLSSTLRALSALLLFALGWLLIFQQQQRLWARLPADAVQRYAADAVASPLPEAMPLLELRRLCPAPRSLPSQALGRLERAELAACLVDAQPSAEASAEAASFYVQQLQAQIAATEHWLQTFNREAPQIRQALAAELQRLQRAGAEQPTREAIGPQPAPDATARHLRALVEASRQRIASLPAQPDVQQALKLGLLASGRQLQLDYGSSPPAAHFASDRDTLADALEWRRRAQVYGLRGFSLERLHGLPAMLLLSSIALLLAVLLSRGPLLPWALASQLLGFSALLLSDLALTADPALRYLVERQFFALGSGSRWLNLSLELPFQPRGQALRLWWPLLVLAGLVLGLSRIRHAEGRLLAPLRAWVGWGSEPRRSALQAGLLLVLGLLATLGLGIPAAVSEGLIALGCIGLASYVARQAGFANAGGGLDAANLMVALGALAVAIAGALLRGDLGHALVALAMGAGFFALFGGRVLRLALLAILLLGLGLLLELLLSSELPAPLQALLQLLPAHAQERVLAMIDPYQVASSDLARTRWLMHSAGLSGWGLGWAPWQGFAASANASAGLPLQGPSDYVLAIAVALWGQLGGLSLLALALLLFGGAAALASRTALRPGMPLGLRWLAALGLFGCGVMTAKILLSLGGVAGVLPLTGLPVALLGYGPVGNLAALLYLALALGTAQARGRIEQASGARLQLIPTRNGLLRRRSALLAGGGLLGIAALLALALWQMRVAAVQGQHLARARFELAGAVARSLLPAGEAAPPEACPQLLRVARDWDVRLADQRLRLDLPTLLTQNSSTCRQLSRELGTLLQTDLRRVLSPLALSGEATRLAAFFKQRQPQAAARDFSTANVWWGLPGCAHATGSSAPAGCSGLAGVEAQLSDIWLQSELAPRLQAGLLTPTGNRELHGHAVATGPQLGLTLDPALQASARQIADCFTARRPAADCAGALPQDAAWRQRFFEAAGSLRASALGLVMAEVDTGRVVALASAVSDCALEALSTNAKPGPQGQRAALQPQAPQRRCAQWPDRGSDYLALQNPALWMVPPGSSLKPLALLAGIEAGQIGEREDGGWKRILAESQDKASVQRAALNAGRGYLQTLGKVGFADTRSELLWGTYEAPPLQIGWHLGLRSGTADLRPPLNMPYTKMATIRQEKEAGVNVDQRHDQATIVEYLAARKLADSSIGSADVRISALGLADVWRRLDLRARGQAAAPAMHLLEMPGRTPDRIALDFSSPAAAHRALAATSGVSASAWGGTAQGSCRVVMGSCPAEGLPGLLGKTGTSDFLTQEDSPWVKPGLQLPAKLFGGVFSHGGKRYALAAMALRVREGGSLELRSSAAAEAALTLMRETKKHRFLTYSAAARPALHGRHPEPSDECTGTPF